MAADANRIGRAGAEDAAGWPPSSPAALRCVLGLRVPAAATALVTPRRPGRADLRGHAAGRPPAGVRLLAASQTPQPRRAAQGLGALRERLLARPADAALAHDHLHGSLPPQNGVRDNLGYALGSGSATLAALLKTKGYATGGGGVLDRALARDRRRRAGSTSTRTTIEPTKASQSISRVQRARRRDRGAPRGMDRRHDGTAVLRVPPSLRAALAVRAAGALSLAAIRSLRRRDRPRRRDRRQRSCGS